MKVYFYYMIPPTEIPHGVSEESFNRFELVTYHFNSRLPSISFDDNGDENAYLYAVTWKKKDAKKFEELHDMKYFRKIVKKFDNYDSDEIKHQLMTISKYSIIEEYFYTTYKGEQSSLPLTKFEIQCIQDYGSDSIDVLFEYLEYPYEIYKKNYMMALDSLLYCVYYNSNNDMEGDAQSDFDNYGITPLMSHPHGALTLAPNVEKLFIYLFGMILKV